MNLHKLEKAELIRSGKFEKFRDIKKDQYAAGYEPDKDPKTYGLTEEEKALCDSLEKSTKRKKCNFRKHAWFMHQYYDNVGLLTLGYSNKQRDANTFDWKREQLTEILKQCFCDFIGKFEISPSGKLHAHLIVAWNGEVTTREIFRDGHVNLQVLNKHDLTDLWFGTSDPFGQPTKNGIYDLMLVPNDRTESNMSVNYAMKSLNTMESYIQKDEQIDFHDMIDEELVFQVNTSNIITARGTPFQEWNKARTLQDKDIKRKCRVFDSPFYEAHKWQPMTVFREWATRHKDDLLTPKLRLFEEDFKLVDITDF